MAISSGNGRKAGLPQTWLLAVFLIIFVSHGKPLSGQLSAGKTCIGEFPDAFLASKHFQQLSAVHVYPLSVQPSGLA